jgi:CRISPR/Cas system-associated protein Cas10 (large subunit of type III CRISPR-Cas system)
MSCLECGGGGESPSEIEYIDRRTETLRLCQECRSKYAEGGFVAEVSPAELQLA